MAANPTEGLGVSAASGAPDGKPEPCRGEVRFTFVSASQDEAGEIIEMVVDALASTVVFFEGGSCERMHADDVISGSPLASALARREAALTQSSSLPSLMLEEAK